MVPRLSRLESVRLDLAALSSPSLHTLDTTVYANFDADSTPSKFTALRDCLCRARGLKNLTLRLERGVSIDLYQPGEVNLQLRPCDVLHPLESLTLDGDMFDLNAQQCQMWLRCMDWSKLRKLEIAQAMPHGLLPALTGHVRGLVKLKLGFWPIHRWGDRIQTWASPTHMQAVRQFLESIDALREVTLFTGEHVDCKQLEPPLLHTHGDSLKRLVVKLGLRQGWNLSHFEDLKMYAPQLEELEVPVEMYQEKEHRGSYAVVARGIVSLMPVLHERQRQRLCRPVSRSVWPTNVHAILTTFPRLRHLRLDVQLKFDSIQFIPDSRPGAECFIMDEMAEETVTRLFKESGRMETLVVTFRSVAPCVVQWTYTVERRWVPDQERYRVCLEKKTTGELRELQRRRVRRDVRGD